MPTMLSSHSADDRAGLRWPRVVPLALTGALTLALGGCLDQLASAGCKRVKNDELHVAPGKSCSFQYGAGDTALYFVQVTQSPSYGEAKGDGKYLKYTAKPGFKGDDFLRIRVVRRGIGHVQWQDVGVVVKVRPQT
jgi:hypothetical protein